jgi:glycine betaine/proline transport system ATP-binding protein
MEPPVAVLGAEQGPRMAHKLMREQQQAGLYVTGRDRRLLGYVMEEQIADRLDAGNVQAAMEPCTTVIGAQTPVAELFTPSAETRLPLPVVDEDQRLIGVIPRVTLLAALGTRSEVPGAGDAPATETEEVDRAV